MSFLRQIARGIGALIHPSERDRDVSDEVQEYLDEAIRYHVARGLTREQAARAATLDMGNATVTREQVRTAGWEHWLETALADVRYAVRRLRNAPVFAATATITLALGLGASTAVFSAVSPILLEPLPFPHADRLVTIDDQNADGIPMPATLGTYDELRARLRSFDAIAAADRWQPSLVGVGEPEQLEGQRITASYFGVFGAIPVVGRDFTAADDQPGGPRIVILSEGLVDRRFGGDRSIVGRTIELGGDPYTVVGVMPHRFDNVIAPSAEIWTPMQERSTGEFNSRAWGHHYELVGRLAPSATIASAAREISNIGETPAIGYPRPFWANLKGGLVVRSVQDAVTTVAKPALLAILGAVALLLAIAAVNVTNLLLGRSAQRRAELAMRIALGAARGRVLAQMITESVVLAAFGGATGLGIAWVGVRAFVAVSPPGLPRLDAVRIDARVFVFAFLLTTLVGIIVGLAPAIGALRDSSADALHNASRRSTGRGALRHALVVAEVALALVLLVSAGLLLRSVRQLSAVAPGFDPSHVLTMQVVEAGHRFHSDTARLEFFQQALAAVRRVPGVTEAAFTSQLPLSGETDAYGYEWQSRPSIAAGQDGSALRYAVMPGYFDAMRIPLRRGRLLGPGDRPGAPEAVVINESLARRLFGDRNPIGERVRFGPEVNSGHPWDYVVGVVGDVKQYALAAPAPDAFYVANGQWWWVDNVQTLVVRTTGDAAALAPALQRAIWSVNRNVPIRRVKTMSQFVSASAGQRGLALIAIETFAFAALVLAAVGLYGVMSGSVSERVREIGIRAALGASPVDLVRQVMKRGVALTLAGAALGIVGAVGATKLIASMLFQISRIDFLTYGAVVALLAAVTMLAAWLPARRAATIDPTIALRAE